MTEPVCKKTVKVLDIEKSKLAPKENEDHQPSKRNEHEKSQVSYIYLTIDIILELQSKSMRYFFIKISLF